MFTQSCYIKRNNKHLRKELERIGYKLNHGKVWGKYLACFKPESSNECMCVASPEWDMENMPDFDNAVNCGDNEGLLS